MGDNDDDADVDADDDADDVHEVEDDDANCVWEASHSRAGIR